MSKHDDPMNGNHEEYANALKERTIAVQKAKMETYIALKLQGLPIPADLQEEIESVLQDDEVRVSNRFIDFLYILARDHLTTGAIEDILYNFVDTEQSSYYNHFIEGYARDLAIRLLDDSVPITNWKHMYRSPDGKTKFTGGDNPHYGA